MRWLGLWAGVLLAIVVAGCGGGNHTTLPQTGDQSELRVTYFYGRTTIAQQTTQEEFNISAKLWIQQNDALLTNPTWTVPLQTTSLTLAGPSLIPPTDGVNAYGVPVVVFWGQGASIPGNQPTVVQPSELMPGYVRPSDNLYLYEDVEQLTGNVPVVGQYALQADGGYTRTWNVNGVSNMLPAATITSPSAIAVNQQQPIKVQWDAVPGAAGYFVDVESQVKDAQGNLLGKVVWTSATKATIFDAVYDFSPLLLPADTRSVTIPAGVFAGCSSISISVLTQAAGYRNTSAIPALRIVNASLATGIFALYSH